jgi:hypothetical protein
MRMAPEQFSGERRAGSNRPGRWLGGYKREGRRGPTYIIERWIDGRRYHVSTKCRTERAALAQLAEFEMDPANYRPHRTPARGGPVRRLVMTAELVDEYRAWMLNRPHLPASVRHADTHERVLMEWMAFYTGRDIRTVPLRDLIGHIERGRNRPMRVQALKSFCAWLRRVKFLMDRAEDPTVDIARPPQRATKDSKRVAIEPERILKVLPHLPSASRDVLILRLGTGWHGAEVERWAKIGELLRTPGKAITLLTESGPKQVPLLAVLRVPQRKANVWTNTPILHEEHLAAAERIRKRGYVPSGLTLNRHVTAACKEAGVERFLNWHLRHSVISHAIESGVDTEQAGAFVDHLKADTTRRHYAQIALPKKAVPVVRVPTLRLVGEGG